jgi:hypothetical protein
MRVEFIDSFAPVSRAQIECAEGALGFSLPQDYRHFLEAHNGGSFAGRTGQIAFRSLEKLPEEEEGFVERLYPVSAANDTDYTLEAWGYKSVDSLRLPSSLIAIGHGARGSVVLSPGGIRPPGVYLWDKWSYDHTSADPYHNVYCVRRSFDEFIASLYDKRYGSDVFHDPLLAAAHDGLIDEVADALQREAKVDKRGDDGMTMLMAACGRPRMTRFLLENGAKVNARDDAGREAIWHAASYDVARILLDHGANANSADSSGCTALIKATEFRIQKLLVQRGADVNARTRAGVGVFEDGRAPRFYRLIADAGYDVEPEVRRLTREIASREFADRYRALSTIIAMGALASSAENALKKIISRSSDDADRVNAELALRSIFGGQ